MITDWLITATPPTPNGDLHVGHMSGPYLAADIYRRARTRVGDKTSYICYGDDNQSYVVTTAHRLGMDPAALLKAGNSDIRETLSAYNIWMDDYLRPDGGHTQAVGDTIRLLVEKGLIVRSSYAQLFDEHSGNALYEAFSNGYCNVCLEKTKGGICEACGHPNDPVDLFGTVFDQPVRSTSSIRARDQLVLPVEAYRQELLEYYKDKRGRWRPHLIQLVDELMSKPLADFPISHPGTWGIPIGLANWEEHVVNVWAEMGIGLLYALGHRRTNVEMQRAKYVQFLGYDNSYFFAIVHPVLHFAMRRAGLDNTKLADFIVTNEFYHLEHMKFSTSQGHAIWGRELLEHMTVEEARFYLSLNGPELAEANFDLQEAQRSLDRNLRKPLQEVLDRIRGIRRRLTESPNEPLTHRPQSAVVAAVEERLTFFSQPEHFSPRQLARILRNLLVYLASVEVDISRSPTAAIYEACFVYWAEQIGIFMPQLSGELLETANGPCLTRTTPSRFGLL